MSAWGNKDDKTSAGTVTLTAPAITFNGATGHAAGVYVPRLPRMAHLRRPERSASLVYRARFAA